MPVLVGVQRIQTSSSIAVVPPDAHEDSFWPSVPVVADQLSKGKIPGSPKLVDGELQSSFTGGGSMPSEKLPANPGTPKCEPTCSVYTLPAVAWKRRLLEE